MSEAPNTHPPVVPPDLAALLRQWKADVLRSVNCAHPGEIQSFDKDTITATVKIMMKLSVPNRSDAQGKPDDSKPTVIDYPVLVDCPVAVLTGGAAALTMPVAAGDPCLVFFCDRDIDLWFVNGTAQVPNSPRVHSLADGVALVGIRPKPKAIANFATIPELRNDAGQVRVVSANDAARLESGLGAVVTAKTLVRIANTSYSLRTAMDALFSALTSWVDTHGDSPNSTTVTALNSAKDQFDGLLDT